MNAKKANEKTIKPTNEVGISKKLEDYFVGDDKKIMNHLTNKLGIRNMDQLIQKNGSAIKSFDSRENQRTIRKIIRKYKNQRKSVTA